MSSSKKVLDELGNAFRFYETHNFHDLEKSVDRICYLVQTGLEELDTQSIELINSKIKQLLLLLEIAKSSTAERLEEVQKKLKFLVKLSPEK
ncbi:MAG: hypothetical protein NZT61_06320 [Deltaproteobacteria bacterium]|nr:hypothetical protein [Deltaproteobacteria bacterium]MCX7953346.1 hypothetical protein [Deltaproteobacteria bacterium]